MAAQPATQPHQPPAAPRFFLWVHLFEPHAPYGDPSIGRAGAASATTTRSRPPIARSAGCSARSDRRASDTLIVAAGDHGEAFGEHGEYAHSIFVYDTTLRVPLIMRGPGIAAGDRVAGRGDAGGRGADGHAAARRDR